MIEFVAHLRNHDDFVEEALTLSFPAKSAAEAQEIVRQCCAGRWCFLVFLVPLAHAPFVFLEDGSTLDQQIAARPSNRHEVKHALQEHFK